MPPPSSRMTKNRPQPTRYRPGKAEVEDQDSEDESSEEDDAPPVQAKPPTKATSFPSQKKLAVDLSKAEKQVSAAPNKPSAGQEEDLDGFVTASESEEEDEDGGSGSEVGDAESDSEEEEESSSDDEPEKPMLAPKFISKAKRGQQTANANGTEDKAAEQELLRQEKADAMLQAQLERDAAARAAGKKFWDDDDNIADDEPDTDDEKDVEEAKAAWKLRELKRVRRERLAIEVKEKEREEVERRRGLTAEEREKEDREFIAQQNEEREGEGRGKMAYMQKYFHKGAFFDGDEAQDDEVKQALNRDLAGARFVDETGDKSVLPEYMRIRDMTKLGRKGRTKYKDLKNEDTGRWGADVGRRKREFDDRGLDERFRPDDNRGDEGRERTGANNAPLGKRPRYE